MGWLLLSLRRLRDARATSVVLAVTVAVTAFVFAAAPRLVETAATDTLRDEVHRASSAARNLQVLQDGLFGPGAADLLEIARSRGEQHERRFPPEVRSLVAERVLLVDSPRWLVSSKTVAEATLKLRIDDGAAEHLTLEAGRWPTAASRRMEATDPDPPGLPPFTVTVLEVALSRANAAVLGAEVGDVLVLRIDPSDRVAVGHDNRLAIEVVGLFAVRQPAAERWFDDPALERPIIRTPTPTSQIQDATALLSPGQYRALYDEARTTQLPLRYTWRYRVDPARFAAPELADLVVAMRRLESDFPRGGAQAFNADPILRTALLRVLEEQQARWRSVETVLAVIALGPAVVTLAGLGLVAVLAGVRRRPSLALARGRGASVRQLVASVVLEAGVLASPGVALGALGATLLVASGPFATSTVLAIAVGGAVTAFLLAATVPPALRASRGAPAAATAAPARLAPRRLVLEALLVGLALVGIVLLRDRGVRGGSTAADLAAADPLIAAVPALAGFAAAVVAMRVFPLPMRLLAEIAAAGRGLVAALAIRRAVRGGASAVVLVVLLAASALGAFSSATLVHVARAADAIAWDDVGADYLVTSTTGVLPLGLVPTPVGSADEAPVPLPGVAAAALGWSGVAAIQGKSTRITIVALDLDAFGAVTAGTRAALDLPPDLTRADESGAGAPIPLVMSRAVTRPDNARYGPGDGVDLTVGGSRLRFQVAGLADRAPIAPGDQFAVVSRAVLEEAVGGRDLRPTALLLRAPDSAAAGLRAALAEISPGLVLHSRAEGTAAALGAPAVIALRDGIALAALVVAVYAAIAVLAALILAGAARASEVAHLRTLGLSRRQALGLMVTEQAPVLIVAVVGGVALGLGLFVLLRPGLGLDGLLGGSAPAVPLGIETVHLAALVAATLAVVAVGILLGAAVQGGSRVAQALRRGIE